MARSLQWWQALLLVAVLVVILWRSGLESSLWIDEIHSLQVAHLSPAEVVEAARLDVHPPGYFLALKGWLKAGRLLGLDPGVRWARGLGVVVWLGMTLAVWVLTRRLAGAGTAGVVTSAVAGGAMAADLAVELRGYVVVFAAAVIAFLAVLLAERRGRAGETRRAAGWWSLYALSAVTALWNHLLAAPLFLLIAVAWLVVWVTATPLRVRRLVLGVSTQLLVTMAFLPWLLRVPGQVDGLAGSGTDWMTPATSRELGFVLSYWFPFGRVAGPDVSPYGWLNLLGAAALLVPLAALLRARPSVRPAVSAGLPVGLAFAFTLLLWLLARWQIAPVFHGPRYPALAAGLWALGIAGLALAAARRWDGVPEKPAGGVTPAVLLLPWFAAAVVGHGLALGQEARGGLPSARPAIAAALGSSGEPLYVSPSELAPFFRRTLRGFDIEPVEGVACGLLERGRAVVLDVNRWTEIERPRDRVLARAANRGLLAVEARWSELPTPALGATLLELRGAGPLAGEHCRHALAPVRPWSGEPAAAALPDHQLRADGWSRLEIGDDLVPRRWGTRSEVALRFDRPLPAGDYSLHLVGHRVGPPARGVEVCVVPPGAAEPTCGPQEEGRFESVVPFVLEDALRRPRALVRHPLWSPAELSGSGDRRQLSILLEAGWIVPRPRP